MSAKFTFKKVQNIRACGSGVTKSHVSITRGNERFRVKFIV